MIGSHFHLSEHPSHSSSRRGDLDRRLFHRFLPPDSISKGADELRETPKGIIIGRVNLRSKGGTNVRAPQTKYLMKFVVPKPLTLEDP